MALLRWPFLSCFVIGLLFGTGYLFPGEWIGFGIVSIALALLAASGEAAHVTGKHVFGFGVGLYLVGFYWLLETLQHFGGFGFPVAFLLGLLFAVVSSMQFWIVGWCWGRLRRSRIDEVALAFPLAWTVGEFLIPRLFPWSLAHPSICWTWFASLARLVGVAPLSFLLAWWAALIVRLLMCSFRIEQRAQRKRLAIVLAVAFTPLLFGRIWNQPADALARSFRVGVAQGSLSVEAVNSEDELDGNLQVYQTLSAELQQQGAQLVLWPESVMNDWMPEQVESVSGTRFDPAPYLTIPVIYGGLSVRPRTDEELRQRFGSDFQRSSVPRHQRHRLSAWFNSAIARDVDGRIIGRYHKRVLMPFGEYLPFESSAPQSLARWLRDISPMSGNLDAGPGADPISVALFGPEQPPLSVAALVCYEDIVPRLGREGVAAGAEIFVNLTNDAWYGDTAALGEHHLIASWRAIETERFLIRATNTGLSGVVDPNGRTIRALPTQERAGFVHTVAGLSQQTLFCRFGDLASWLLIAVVVFGLATARRAEQR